MENPKSPCLLSLLIIDYCLLNKQRGGRFSGLYKGGEREMKFEPSDGSCGHREER